MTRTTTRRAAALPENFDHGRALYDFLQKEWDHLGVSATAWCRVNNIPDPTVSRWSTGTEPSLPQMRRVADALGRSLIDILQVAGFLTRDETKDRIVLERETISAREAIQRDRTLEEAEREGLLQVMDAFTLVKAGKANQVQVRTGRARRN